jgi:hypothetical protein
MVCRVPRAYLTGPVSSPCFSPDLIYRCRLVYCLLYVIMSAQVEDLMRAAFMTAKVSALSYCYIITLMPFYFFEMTASKLVLAVHCQIFALLSVCSYYCGCFSLISKHVNMAFSPWCCTGRTMGQCWILERSVPAGAQNCLTLRSQPLSCLFVPRSKLIQPPAIWKTGLLSCTTRWKMPFWYNDG